MDLMLAAMDSRNLILYFLAVFAGRDSGLSTPLKTSEGGQSMLHIACKILEAVAKAEYKA
ncbi:hypothetical protein IEQ34_020177 [Dendrobium chrysotoxum]|uniref:Uncharacterized protein n=1 Tax=Dendrobium chrysotoxum TaxID=161865 RepID=A0AAV7FZS7_DENCH|nr:hypothetical protein IEQ34_020177 [Dendrobium chrysotoxum]